MHHFAILLGGRLTPTPRLKRQLERARFLAADSGMNHAETLAVLPELWLGDFDSAAHGLQSNHAAVPRKIFPSDKDKTDGALAIAEARALGANQLTLVGAFGGQFDHALSHALQMLTLAERGITCMMTSGDEEGYALMPGDVVSELPNGTRMSILGITELKGLSVSGVRWPLENVTVPMGSTWTLSNETTADVKVSVKTGKGLVLVYPLASSS
jgi:thiamine pyrophosphokinase